MVLKNGHTCVSDWSLGMGQLGSAAWEWAKICISCYTGSAQSERCGTGQVGRVAA